MEKAKADFELAMSHLKQVEERIALQRDRIARMRADGLSVGIDEERLASLLRSIEGVKAHLLTLIDPVKPGSFSIEPRSMKYTQAAIDETRRMFEQAQAQVDAQITMILRMRGSRLQIHTAEEALNTMCKIRDQMQSRLMTMTEAAKPE